MRLAILVLFGVISFLPVCAGEEPNSIPVAHQVILKGQWTPNKEQTDKALAAAMALVRTVAAKPTGTTFAEKYKIEGATKISQGMSKYAVQFIGQIRNGKKVIFCNFFPSEYLKSSSSYWKKLQVVVCDGGANYWRVDYDPEIGKCDDFQMNGEA